LDPGGGMSLVPGEVKLKITGKLFHDVGQKNVTNFFEKKILVWGFGF